MSAAPSNHGTPQPPRITFGVDANGRPAPWGAYNMEAIGLLGLPSSVPYPSWLRVWFLALSRLERNGHAPFARGELVTLMSVDTGTGVQAASAETSTDRAIRAARRYGLLAEGSGRSCLIVPARLAQRGRGKTVCPFHGRQQ